MTGVQTCALPISLSLKIIHFQNKLTTWETFKGAKQLSKACSKSVQNNIGQNQYQRAQVNPQNNPYSPTYNLRWRNHPNFSYRNQNPVIPPSNGPQAP